MLYLVQMMIVNDGIPAHGNYKINNKLGLALVIVAISIKIKNQSNILKHLRESQKNPKLYCILLFLFSYVT